VVIIREAVPQDAGELSQLLRLLTNDSKVDVLSERLEELRNCSHSFVFVAELDGSLAGTAQLTLCPDVMYRFQPYAIVENIFVREAMRKQGVGKALMAEVEKLCLAQDCSKIMLLSSVRREAAHRFFESLGYEGDSKRGFVKYRRALAIQK
jgi:GNAT superfamily N-acetyltransferase